MNPKVYVVSFTPGSYEPSEIVAICATPEAAEAVKAGMPAGRREDVEITEWDLIG